MKAPTVVNDVIGASFMLKIEYGRAVHRNRHASFTYFLTCPSNGRNRLVDRIDCEPLLGQVDGVSAVAAANVQRSLSAENTVSNPLIEILVWRKHENGTKPFSVIVEGLPIRALGNLELQCAIHGCLVH